MHSKYDGIIIGGGISGLFLGALLSKKGKNILLCEKSKTVGGRYQGTTKEGVSLEYGFKANRFADQGYVKELFTLLEEPLSFTVSKEAAVYEENEFISLPRGIIPILRYKKFGFKSKWIFLKLYKELLSTEPDHHYNETVEEWLKSRTQSEEIFRLFEYYSQLALVSPNLAITSVGEFIFVAKKGLTATYPFGVPTGGWQKQIERLCFLIRKTGALITECKVDQIILEDHKAVGVQFEGKSIYSDWVITAFPLSHGLFQLLDEHLFPSKFTNFVKNLIPTAGINIDFCLNKILTSESRLIATRSPYPNTQGIFVSNFDPEVAPPGKMYGSWLSILPYEKMKDSAFVEQATINLKNLLGRMFPNIWSHCEWERVLRLHTVNGVAPLPSQTNEKRPDFIAPGIKNLFFVGDTTKGQGGGGDVAMSSVLGCYKKIASLLN